MYVCMYVGGEETSDEENLTRLIISPDVVLVASHTDLPHSLRVPGLVM